MDDPALQTLLSIFIMVNQNKQIQIQSTYEIG